MHKHEVCVTAFNWCFLNTHSHAHTQGYLTLERNLWKSWWLQKWWSCLAGRSGPTQKRLTQVRTTEHVERQQSSPVILFTRKSTASPCCTTLSLSFTHLAMKHQEHIETSAYSCLCLCLSHLQESRALTSEPPLARSQKTSCKRGFTD